MTITMDGSDSECEWIVILQLGLIKENTNMKAAETVQKTAHGILLYGFLRASSIYTWSEEF